MADITAFRSTLLELCQTANCAVSVMLIISSGYGDATKIYPSFSLNLSFLAQGERGVTDS